MLNNDNRRVCFFLRHWAFSFVFFVWADACVGHDEHGHSNGQLLFIHPPVSQLDLVILPLALSFPLFFVFLFPDYLCEPLTLFLPFVLTCLQTLLFHALYSAHSTPWFPASLFNCSIELLHGFAIAIGLK
jgi:hypothetical protein